jgi:hypothetical protein
MNTDATAARSTDGVASPAPEQQFAPSSRGSRPSRSAISFSSFNFSGVIHSSRHSPVHPKQPSSASQKQHSPASLMHARSLSSPSNLLQSFESSQLQESHSKSHRNKINVSKFKRTPGPDRLRTNGKTEGAGTRVAAQAQETIRRDIQG